MGQPGIATNDFAADLKYSEDASSEPFWDVVYRVAFPSMLWHKLCSGDTAGQRRGVDRLVYLSNDRVVRIDEKKRRKDYGDLFLEYISVDTTGAPGWIEKDLAIDYLAYAIMPRRRVYLFDWLMLKRAWSGYGERWKGKYPCKPARNNGYTTWGVCVPIDVVRKAVSNCRIIQV